MILLTVRDLKKPITTILFRKLQISEWLTLKRYPHQSKDVQVRTAPNKITPTSKKEAEIQDQKLEYYQQEEQNRQLDLSYLEMIK